MHCQPSKKRGQENKFCLRIVLQRRYRIVAIKVHFFGRDMGKKVILKIGFLVPKNLYVLCVKIVSLFHFLL
ncbi:hypothetical protein CJD36_021285 [Flavipsychrobacter stenotrophus]|uniref:Uncharacterized protein n=1 Tax=Flavipsychrobacter stenotrophus TaxID=2077091 RepID=A0A2S7SQR1_9BACT|nr:hypothetical protein CJD36_021285 [Flavipsychrobacter stenotrophus]